MPSGKDILVSNQKLINLLIYIGVIGAILLGILKLIWPQIFGQPNYLYFIIPLVLCAAFYNVKKSRIFYNKIEDLK